MTMEFLIGHMLFVDPKIICNISIMGAFMIPQLICTYVQFEGFALSPFCLVEELLIFHKF